MEWGLRRVVPAVTTHAKPHAQQQLARGLEVGRAAMGQRCRPQSLGDPDRLIGRRPCLGLINTRFRAWLD